MEENNKTKWKKPSYTFKTEDDVLNFGKMYNGWKIIDVMKTEPGYIDWCISDFKGFKLHKKLKETFEQIKKDIQDGK